MNEVERDAPHYWEVIANEIGTRNALQCQRFHQGEAPSTVKKKPKAKKQKVAGTKYISVIIKNPNKLLNHSFSVSG